MFSMFGVLMGYEFIKSHSYVIPSLLDYENYRCMVRVEGILPQLVEIVRYFYYSSVICIND